MRLRGAAGLAAWGVVAATLAATGAATLAPAAAQDSTAHGGADGGADGGAYGGLPEGEGRVLVYNMCNACHSLDMVTQQHMTRTRWDRTLEWMQVEQGMPDLTPEDETIVLDYLSEHFGPGKAVEGVPGGGGFGGFGGFGGTRPFSPQAPPAPGG
ncbi:hypothetical protein [Roseospira goensis]|uniref:Cytochrome c5 n=1 Tax=Roseospira goensis TaxID=391922 RepID=A0A7W6S1V0_9PROT|nr:hypothetical protein [Roseospira goensis]MBB4287197.1 cytochrome c5 [Roseospira goensis]